MLNISNKNYQTSQIFVLSAKIFGGFAIVATLIIILSVLWSSYGLTSQAELSLEPSSGDLYIYRDGLEEGWNNWSWNSTIDFATVNPVKEGAVAIASTYNDGWAGLYLHNKNPISIANYKMLRFWLHGGQSGGQILRVVLADQGTNLLQDNAVTISAQAGTWKLVEIPFNQLGTPSAISGIVWQDTTGGAQSPFYVDEVALVGSTPTASSSSIPQDEPSESSSNTPQIPSTVTPSISGSIYSDALGEEWDNWSWGSTIDFATVNPIKEGTAAMAVTYNVGWSGLYLHHNNPISIASYNKLRFWLHGGQNGGQVLRVVLADQTANLLEESAVTVNAQAGSFRLVEIPFSELGNPTTISGIVWQDTTGSGQDTFYLDDIMLVSTLTPDDSTTSENASDVPESTSDAPESASDAPESVSDERKAYIPKKASDAPESASDGSDSVSDVPQASSRANIYSDAVEDKWSNWSWGSTIDFAETNPVKEGSSAIAVTYNQAWAGLYLHTEEPIYTASYNTLRFWLHGGQKGGQALRVVLADQEANLLEDSAVTVSAQAEKWNLIEIPLSQLGNASAISGIVWQDTTGGAQASFYIDGVALIGEKITTQAEGGAESIIYSDSLEDGWVNWSWGSVIDFAKANPVKEGTTAIAITYQEPWVALYLHSNQPISTAIYEDLRFWLHGGENGGQALRVVLANEAANLLDKSGISVKAQAGTWSLIEIPLSQLGNPSAISGIVWQDTTGGAQPTFYIDDVTLVGSRGSQSIPAAEVSAASVNGPTLMIDATSKKHAINPNIYGINFASKELASDLALPINRWGGNGTTRYNWQNDTSNRASDWFFENIPNDNDQIDQLPVGSAADKFVIQNQATGTSSLLTIPLIGWTAKSRDYACAFSVSKYGIQQKVDNWRPDCGNGVRADGSLITNNDPRETSIPITPSFVEDWIKHLNKQHGTAQTGGVQFYNLDNEPMLWSHIHRDVHPQATSYDELRDLTYLYGAAIKKIDPNAKTLGPVLWGWTAYFYSAVDQESNNWLNPPDRQAHGDMPLVEWYLQQMSAYEQEHGIRILDYLDLHYYPQATDVPLSATVDANTQALRLRSTRSLWDPNYKDESWIGEPVQLIPRMRDWVNKYYPGTKLALSEYNWGALDHINGALAQADVLGIFGREGLDLATLWDSPDFNEPGAYAFRLYRNYDGKGSTFGDISLSASSSNQDQLAIYAAKRHRDGALTLIIINKTPNILTSQLTLTGSSAIKAEVYRYSAANLNAIVQEADQTINGGHLKADYPANSITLLVLR